jgi:hypothetical protein
MALVRCSELLLENGIWDGASQKIGKQTFRRLGRHAHAMIMFSSRAVHKISRESPKGFSSEDDLATSCRRRRENTIAAALALGQSKVSKEKTTCTVTYIC